MRGRGVLVTVRGLFPDRAGSGLDKDRDDDNDHHDTLTVRIVSKSV